MADYDDNTTPGLETKDELGDNPAALVRRWLLELRLADKREREWRKTAQSVLELYRGETTKKNSFNILWSNTETMLPAIYSTPPKPDVRRRYKDADKIGKVVSEVVSRALEFSIDTYDFDSLARADLLDMLLVGRGISRVRYVPSMKQVGLDPEYHDEDAEDPEHEAFEGVTEELEWEQTVAEHVQWDDFRFGPGKRWEDVCWEAFRHRMSREDLCKKFGDEIGKAIQLDATNDDDLNKMADHEAEAFKTAEVWEIWDKDERQVLFINASYKAGPLKVVDDPLGLQGFFPNPRPIYAVQDVDSLTPVCLYEQYKEQAEELNRISTRINKLVDALKLRGVYDATISELSEVMRGNDNDMIPAQNVTALIERGGLDKAIWTTEALVKAGAQVLAQLYLQRDAVKQTIYEITGMGDILRGASNPNETATAQQIKSQWGSLRIKRMQQDVARYLRDILRIKAEIIAEKFDQSTLQQMTLVNLPTQEQIMLAQQQGQQVDPNAITWEQVMQVLRSDLGRTYRIDVETDSTVASSIEADMSGMREVLEGIVGFVQGIGPAVQAKAVPIEAVKEIVMTVTRRARMGSAVEDAFDKMQAPQEQGGIDPAQAQQKEQQYQQQIQQLTQQLQQAQQQAQSEQAKIQADMQAEQMRGQITSQVEQFKAQQEMMLAEQQLAFDRWQAELEAQTKIQIAQIQAGGKTEAAMVAAMNKSESVDG